MLDATEENDFENTIEKKTSMCFLLSFSKYSTPNLGSIFFGDCCQYIGGDLKILGLGALKTCYISSIKHGSSFDQRKHPIAPWFLRWYLPNHCDFHISVRMTPLEGSLRDILVIFCCYKWKFSQFITCKVKNRLSWKINIWTKIKFSRNFQDFFRCFSSKLWRYSRIRQ